MRVLLTSDCVGGVWTYALDLAQELTRTGHEVVLAVQGGLLADDQREALEGAGLHAWDAQPYALEWMPEPAEDLAAAGSWLLGLVTQHAPDVVHLNQFHVGVGPWPCPALVVAHSDVVTWWRAVHGSDPPPAWDDYRERVAAGLTAADLVVAPTAAMLHDLQAAYDVATPAAVVHNARRLSLPDLPKQPQIAAVARVWDEAKNVAAAVRASADLAWPLVVAGEGADSDGGRRSPSDVAALLASSSIFVAPARYEPFGLAALEAGLAGCALVLGDIPSLREVWDDAAMFVGPDDESALRSALQSLIDDPDLLQARQAAAAARARAFDLETVAATYADLYRQLCSAPRVAWSGGLVRIVLFVHSLLSDWNHGNAHFLRGVVTELQARGHDVAVYEPHDGWSRAMLISNRGGGALNDIAAAFPHLRSTLYDLEEIDLDEILDGSDLVIAHEWNAPELIARLGHHRATATYRLLFHDTHHRAVTQSEDMRAYDLSEYDGVLAFGEVIRDIYVEQGWARRAWTWHEAADTRVFHPLDIEAEHDLVWIGNWGDDERTAELDEFLLAPAAQLELTGTIHGVRYPPDALERISATKLSYERWIPNHRVPEAFARHRLTVHVPRRPYAKRMTGVPTIRVFEALACGIPLICAPWDDSENLFRPGVDYLIAATGTEMAQRIAEVRNDASLAADLRRSGLETITARHTCGHRVDELLAIYEDLT